MPRYCRTTQGMTGGSGDTGNPEMELCRHLVHAFKHNYEYAFGASV